MTGMTGVAEAKPHPHGPPADPDLGSFWREVIEPHGEVVTAIVARARATLGGLRDGDEEADASRDLRVRQLRDAYGTLRHAHHLDPENAEVLGLLGTVADELGKTDQAVEALSACVRLHGPERAGAEVTGRLGMIELRRGKLDDAIRWLRYAQGPISAADHATAAVYLATALAARGEMAAAIDLLGNAVHGQTNYFTDPVALVSFALAVQYDRDEQRGAAFEVLDRMATTLQQELGPFAQRALAAIRFAPAEDEYYYEALLYEALGDYTEARAQWALYASVTDAPWRRRALEHVQAIDAQRSAHPGPRRPPGTGPSGPASRRLPPNLPVP